MTLPAIHQAASDGAIKLLKRQLQRGADPNLVHDGGDARATPLTMAVMNEKSRCVDFLLNNKADPDGKGAGHTPPASPLMIACMLGNDCIAETLVRHGAALNTSDNDELTALHHACLHGDHGSCVAVLIAAGANVTHRAQGKTAIQAAKSKGHTACVQALQNNAPAQAAAAHSAGELEVGTCVRIVGLTIQPEHNGQSATIHGFDGETRRHMVLLDGDAEQSDGDTPSAWPRPLLYVKPANLVELEKSPPGTHCANCLMEEPAETTLKRCAGCVEMRLANPASYCGVDCQRQHWKSGHKQWHVNMEASLERTSSMLRQQNAEVNTCAQAADSASDSARHSTQHASEDTDEAYNTLLDRSMAAHAQQQDYKTAARLLRKAIKLDDTRLDAYMQLGLIYQQQESWAEAVSNYHSALKLSTPQTREWAMLVLQIVASSSATHTKFFGAAMTVTSSVGPSWLRDPFAQVRVAKQVCKIMPDHSLAWHWRASMTHFLKGRYCMEAAICWRRAALCDCQDEMKDHFLQWAIEAEAGTGEPPMPGMWDGPGGSVTKLDESPGFEAD